MSGEVKGYLLFNFANVADFFKVCVHLLIAQDWQDFTVLELSFVLFEDFLRHRQEGYVHVGLGFLTVSYYPQATIEHFFNVVCP